MAAHFTAIHIQKLRFNIMIDHNIFIKYLTSLGSNKAGIKLISCSITLIATALFVPIVMKKFSFTLDAATQSLITFTLGMGTGILLGNFINMLINKFELKREEIKQKEKKSKEELKANEDKLKQQQESDEKLLIYFDHIIQHLSSNEIQILKNLYFEGSAPLELHFEDVYYLYQKKIIINIAEIKSNLYLMKLNPVIKNRFEELLFTVYDDVIESFLQEDSADYIINCLRKDTPPPERIPNLNIRSEAIRIFIYHGEVKSLSFSDSLYKHRLEMKLDIEMLDSVSVDLENLLQ